MSSETIQCLVYRYYRIKERICAVKIKDSKYIILDEMEYRSECDFFKNSNFSDFLESTSIPFDLCIICQDEDKGRNFYDLFQNFYKIADDSSSIWTSETIKEALENLNLKKSLKIGNISIEGKDSRFEYASVFTEKGNVIMDSDDTVENSYDDEVYTNAKEEIFFTKTPGNEEKTDSGEAKCLKAKSSLCLAMDKIISENYKNK